MLLVFIGCAGSHAAGDVLDAGSCDDTREPAEGKIAPALLDLYDAEGEPQSIGVVMTERLDFTMVPSDEPERREALRDLDRQAAESQRCAIAELERTGGSLLYSPTLGNLFFGSAHLATTQVLATRTDVLRISRSHDSYSP